MATIAKRTTRQVRRLYNDQHVQKLLEGTWTSLRIGVMWGYTDAIPTTQVSSNSSVFIGLCAGNGGVLDAAPVACMGLEVYATWINRRTDMGTPGFISTTGGGGWSVRGYQKEGATLTRSSAMTYPTYPIIASAAYDYCSVLIVDINRSTGQITGYYPGYTDPDVNYSMANFKTQMVAPALERSQTVTCTPPTNAALINSINIASTNEIYPPDFHAVDIRKLS
jgi:hypothetical protein